MSDSGNDFNLDELEKMSQEGLEHFDDDVAMKSIESDAMSQIEGRLGTQEAKVSIWKLLLVAGLVLGLCYFLFALLGRGDAENKLYAANYSAPPFLLNTTERSSKTDPDPIIKVKNLYAHKQYADCLTAIEANNGNTLKEFPDLAFYQGICLLEQGKALEASKAFSNPGIKIEDVRLWYLALAQLSAGDSAASIISLKKLLSLDGNYMKNEASALLSKLE